MKYIKRYEAIDFDLLGYYVVCSAIKPIVHDYKSGEKYFTNDEVIKNFISNSVGLVVDYDNNYLFFKVEYRNKPETKWSRARDYCYYYFVKEDILFYSKDKKECEAFLDARKYNL